MRTTRKRQLKLAIKEKEQILLDIVKEYDPIEVGQKPEEVQEELKKIYQDNVAFAREHITQARQELKMFMMNKTGSSFFSWEPHIGPNRRQRRFMRKQIGIKK